MAFFVQSLVLLKLIEIERGRGHSEAAIYCSAKSGARAAHRVVLLCMPHSNLVIKSSTALQLERLLIDPLLS